MLSTPSNTHQENVATIKIYQADLSTIQLSLLTRFVVAVIYNYLLQYLEELYSLRRTLETL